MTKATRAPASGNLLIRGGRVIDPASRTDRVTDVQIADGRISGVGQTPGSFDPQRTIDAEGMIVCPGFTDLMARLREPGSEQKGTIESETRAAAAGGVTSLVCPPDTDPVIDTPAVARLVQERAAASGHSRVLPLGAMTVGLAGEQLSEMHALANAGCVGMSSLRKSMADHQTRLRCLEYAASFGITVFFQPLINSLARDGCAHEGAISTRLGLAGIPASAETIAVARDLELIEQTGVRAHFGQISCARSVQLISDAQQRGLPVTTDVAIHNLLLTDSSILGFNTLCHLMPPLRGELDRAALRTGLSDGTITAICSDHQPHENAAKHAPYAASVAGASGIEWLWPLGARLVENGCLTLPELVAALTCNPSEVIGKRSALEAGAVADVCIIDPARSWTLAPEMIRSAGHNTPFLGQEMCGKVACTILAGREVYRDPALR